MVQCPADGCRRKIGYRTIACKAHRAYIHERTKAKLRRAETGPLPLYVEARMEAIAEMNARIKGG